MYPTWYGFDHERPALLNEAVYGLTELCNGELKKARLIANPGCYPPSILLALRPLTFLLDREQPVICDSKSGVSGAGKKSDLAWSFAEVFGNFKAYGVGNHRHEPEIRQGLKLGDRASGAMADPGKAASRDDDDDKADRPAVIGLVPTGWYPAGVTTSKDGAAWYVVNGKSPAGPSSRIRVRSSATIPSLDSRRESDPTASRSGPGCDRWIVRRPTA